MKIYGYVRDKDGNFKNRKEKVMSFAKLMNFSIDRIICEKSSENYEDMVEIRKLLEAEKDFVLLVSDTSDLFEDDYAKIMFVKIMDDKNVFLIDSSYPNFDYKMLIEEYSKETPFSFLTNTIISGLEIYARQMKAYDCGDIFYNDMRGRFADWKRTL